MNKSYYRNDWHNYFTLILNCFLVLSVWCPVYTRLVGQEWNISENQYFIILCFHWPAYHSTKGPVMVSDGSQTYPLLHDIYQKASATLGLKSTDCNGKDYVGKWWRTSSRFVVYLEKNDLVKLYRDHIKHIKCEIIVHLALYITRPWSCRSLLCNPFNTAFLFKCCSLITAYWVSKDFKNTTITELLLSNRSSNWF